MHSAPRQGQFMRKKPRPGVIGLASLLAALICCGQVRSAVETETPNDPLAIPSEPFKFANLPDIATATRDDQWNIVVRLGLWAMNVDGTASIGDRSTDFSMDFSDLLENTNFAFMPGIEVSKGKWAVIFNGVFAWLEGEEGFRQTLRNGRVIEGGADIDLDLYIASLALSYRLCDIPLGKDGGKSMLLSLMPAVGLQYTYFSLDINPNRLASRSTNQDLWDPYVGGRVNLQITDKLAWRTEGSIGGFGVGSDLTWAAQSMIDWRFHKSLELNVGYRAMYWDYENGSRELDLTLHGPWIGMSFYFN